nr:PREDICTED: protocadherin beta-11-like [Latimeria chalumnae]|eukprot:XP_014343514.1 PREDICTED: protocadherin beta-11-like [Latimeria chalumnae]
MESGSFVGDIVKDLGLDVQKLSSRKGRFVSENKQYFQINFLTGILFVNDRIDREKLCGQIQSCILHFEVVVNNPLELHHVEVEIQDINDNAPSFHQNELILEMSETTPLGEIFILERAQDLDVGSNALENYQISQNDNFLLEVRSRNDGGKYPELVLELHLDREKENAYDLILTATDGGTPKRSGTTRIHIIVLDANDNRPVFSQAVYKINLLENIFNEHLVVSVSATDLDKGSNSEISYFFREVSDSVKQIFKINRLTGEIRASGMVDFEQVKAYEMNVQAKDGGGLSAHSKVLVEVIDVNDNAPEPSLTSVSSPLPEDCLPGTVVALFSVKDWDSGENGQVSCSIPDSLPFALKSSLKNYYEIVTEKPLDREKMSEYNITITVTDSGSPSLTTREILQIQIADINDNPPTFNQTSYTILVKENNAAGASIGSVKAIDLDTKENAQIIYSVTEKPNASYSLSQVISVNSDNGILYALQSFDYEHLRDFQVLIKAQDKGSPPLSSTATVSVIILDQNDNAPNVLYPLQNISSTADMVLISAESGYLVTKVVAVDADSGQNSWLSYHLLKASNPSLFSVGLYTGEIRTSRLIMDQDGMKQTLIIQVKDNGQPSLSTSVTLRLLLVKSFSNVHLELINMENENELDSKLTTYLIISLSLVCSMFLTSIIVLIFVRFCKYRNTRQLINSSELNFLAASTKFPPKYLDADVSGILSQNYCYEVCRTTASGKSELKFLKPCDSSAEIVCNTSQNCDNQQVVAANVHDKSADFGKVRNLSLPTV